MRKLFLLAGALAGAAAVVLACGSDDDSTFKDGSGNDASADGAVTSNPPGFGPDDGGAIDAARDPGKIVATIRDFRFYNDASTATNPDFENAPFDIDQNGDPSPGYAGGWDDKEIVTDTLGDDNKPVYKHVGEKTLTTHGKESFDQWYRDVEGTNLNVQWPLNLTARDGGGSQYDSNITGVPYVAAQPNGDKGFFPIDDDGGFATAFGNQGADHNFSFSVEIHTQFTYRGGEFLSFRGDDDVFVYIDKKLVMNLGGIHSPEEDSVNVDDLGLAKGQTYPLDFFWAERHVGGSNVLFTTSIALEAVVN